MAGLPCTTCGAESAAFMFTVMETGDTESIGLSCAPAFALGLAASMSEGMSLEMAEAYGALFDQIAAHDARSRSTDATSAGSGRRKGKAAPASTAQEPATPDPASTRHLLSWDNGKDSQAGDDDSTGWAPLDGGFPGELALPLDDVTE